MQSSKEVIPLFIIDPALIKRWSQSDARLTFLAKALNNLDQAIKQHGGRLQVLQGDPVDVLSNLINQQSIDAVFTNRDYTPISRHRDTRLKAVCDDNNITFSTYADQLLNEPEAVTKADGTPYRVFTPFFKRATDHQIAAPRAVTRFSFTGCRLSALLRFGICSVRETYQAIKQAHSPSHGLIRQLYWRDFYFHIGFHFPHVYRSAFHKKYDQLLWDHNPKGLQAWQEGRTGFPIIDAGMRQLLATGYMHNRVRMIVASFLSKNLHIDWRLGERHFAKHLIDYDPALNNGNWQWCASTGCDAQPYFRVFNPWRQQLKFDKACTYIKDWVPELRIHSAKQIHALEKTDDGYLGKIVDIRSTSEESKRRFRVLSNH
jgi:deoxyribodipyrimidine photo-lyase